MSAVLVLAGCSAGADEGDSSSITFMAAAYSDKSQAYWEDLISRFEKEHPGEKVNLSVVSWNDYDQKVSTMLANHQQPDILNYNTYAGYAAEDLLYPVDKVVSSSVRKDFLPAFTKDDTYKGTQYALPFIASARAMYYNKKIFAEAGLSKPPTTWAEFEAAAEKIKEAGYTGYALPLGTEEAQGELSLWMFNGGGGWKDSAGEWAVNSPANVQAVEFLRKLSTVDKVTQSNPGTTNRTDGAWQQFAQGKVGMVMGFPGTFDSMLAKGGLKADSDYAVAPAPVKAAGQKSATLGVQDVLMAFKSPNDKKVEVIRDFLDYFYKADNYQGFLTQEKFLPTTVSGAQALRNDKVLGPYIDLLPNARFAPTSDKSWTQVADATKQTIGLAVQPGHSPAQVLGDIQKRAEEAANR
ncbi:extracellular solute-binding protein [Streptomyces sp. NPDC005799]|uniref:extracellular solute-binding protein n=1 Tax=Streptomyces sp. NPDC005799 TaxID=3154678 RepID=UPI0033CD5053